MKHFETQMPSSAADPLSGAEARSTSACSPEATPTGPVVCPSTASAAATAAGGKRSSKGSEASVRSRCSFCINFFFHATLALVAAVGGVLYCLPPSHWLHVEVSQALSALASSPESPSRLNLSEGLRAAAEHLEGTELAFVSPHLLALAAWGYLDAAAIGALSLLTLLLGTALIRGMLNYKRDREIEVNPPPIRYCQNQMTLEEYNKKDATYAAVQELMASPEFQALKAQRASQGSEAWNWQRRVGSEAKLQQMFRAQGSLSSVGESAACFHPSSLREKIWLERWAESPQVATDGPGTQHGAPEGSSFVQNATNVGKQAAGGLKVPLGFCCSLDFR